MIQISLSEVTAQKLHAAARRRQVDPSELMEDALDAFLTDEQKGQHDEEEAPSMAGDSPTSSIAGKVSTHLKQGMSKAITDFETWDHRQREAIAQETQTYIRQHATLLAQYGGSYIAMRQGQVIDHDTDEVALSRRIRVRYGKEPVLITPVLGEPIQSITVFAM